MSEMHSSLIHKVEELLTLKMFHCGICQQILQIPVILTENFGNVCHSCYEDARQRQQTIVIGLENRILTELLKTLNLPCENESEGCIERIPYDKIHIHKISCRYQTVECELAKCSWKGQYRDLVEHFQDHNKKSILKSIDDTFQIVIPEKKVLNTHILKTVYGIFVLHIKVTGHKFHYILFAADDLEKKLKYHFVMKFIDESQTELNFRCNPIEGSKTFMTFDVASSASVDLNVVKLLSTINWKVYLILYIDTDIYKIRNCIMDCMRCKKCSFYIPNYDNGAVKCPNCFTEEEESHTKDSEIEYPCKFKRSKYSVEVSSDLLHNSQLCNYHPWKCPVKDCGDQLLSYSLLITHMRVNHNEEGICYFDSNCISLSSIASESNERKVIYVIMYDRIFEISHLNYKNNSYYSYDNDLDISWYVNHIGPIEEHFLFEIEIERFKNSRRNFVLYASEECHYNVCKSQVISFHRHLCQFLNEDRFNYKLKISRLVT